MPLLINSARIENHFGKRILVVDFSGKRGSELIEVFRLAKKVISNEPIPLGVLNVFDGDSILSAEFMECIKKEVTDVDRFIERQAIVGLSDVQQWILKEFNLHYPRQISAFDSISDAIRFLTR
ncbi:MAG: hypothetical protein ACOYXT_21390 [Bacteroidota bacterium]